MKRKPTICIDIERMKYKNIGLFTFCNELVLALKDGFKYSYFGTTTFSTIKPKWYHKYLDVPVKNIDIWHATHQDTNYLPQSDVPVVLTIHDLNFLYADKSKSKVDKRLNKVQRLIDRSSFIVVISNYVLEDVKKFLDLKGTPIKVIYNGTKTPEKNLEKQKVLSEEPFLFTIGTVVPKKNFHVLLCLLINSPYKLVVAGNQNDKDYLDSIISEATALGVMDKLELVGPVSENDKNWYYENCRAFLFPSLSEGFGLPVIEAMRFGKPVFCSNLTSLPEIGGAEAYYFTSFDEKHMQDVFTNGMNDYDNDSDKKNKIIAWSNQFTWGKTAQHYEEVYLSVLNEVCQ
ncbi:glycosyltransferase family 4 protein [Flavicella marina]|uniref:glycosyltransferase family 4 protein n=1 Tax=Flavicella marina TaxID=1475951 RepID=UPI0012641678|nr:glycosyltransferase family 1 protein [Flavicella marina]